MNIEQQQKVSFKVLQVLRKIDKDAIIAGGAPRNWKEGKLANDIDCYLRWFGGSCKDMCNTLEELLGVPIRRVHEVTCSYFFGGDSFELKHIFSFSLDDVLFQIMVVAEKAPMSFRKDVLNHMDIGINMISWEPRTEEQVLRDQGYHVTPARTADIDNKTLTLYQNVMNKEQLAHCMRAHLPKMIKYYPNHTLKIAGA
jgi:hypothetical protein